MSSDKQLEMVVGRPASTGSLAMIFSRLTRFAFAAALLLAGCQTGTQPPEELVYASWLPATEYPNRVALPRAFNAIAVETRGAINWKLANNQGQSELARTVQRGA